MENISMIRKKQSDTPCRWTPESDFDKKSEKKRDIKVVHKKKRNSPLKKRILPPLKTRSEPKFDNKPRIAHNLPVYQPQLPFINLRPIIKNPVFGKKVLQKKKSLNLNKSFLVMDISMHSLCLRSMVIDKLNVGEIRKFY